MSDPVIRQLDVRDIDAAFALSTAAGWNQRREDWQMLLQVAPAGSVAAESAGRIVGTAIGIDYGGFGWIAMMLVDEAYRGRGVGGRLLEAAIEAIPRHVSIRLDATPLGRPLYERYGFREETRLTRYVIDGARQLPTGSSSRVRQLTDGDLAVVLDNDPEIFGGDRRAVLEWMAKCAPDYTRVARRDSATTSYCFGRQGRVFDQIGPVVTDGDDVARDLVDAALANAGTRAVAIDAFDSHRAFGSWLSARGFQPQRPLFRMRLLRQGATAPTAAAHQSSLIERAILGPEFA